MQSPFPERVDQMEEKTHLILQVMLGFVFVGY